MENLKQNSIVAQHTDINPFIVEIIRRQIEPELSSIVESQIWEYIETDFDDYLTRIDLSDREFENDIYNIYFKDGIAEFTISGEYEPATYFEPDQQPDCSLDGFGATLSVSLMDGETELFLDFIVTEKRVEFLKWEEA